MFCEYCGTQKEEDVKFCQNCGRKTSTYSAAPSSATELENEDIFYSREWHKKGGFVIVATPRLDVLVDNDYLYLIKLPKYGNSTLGLFLGFLIGSLIGAYIGSSIGESRDAKKREWYRSAWVNANGALINHYYEHSIFRKIPLNSLRGNITFNKSRFTINNEGKKITLGRRVRSFKTPDQTEAKLLNKYIEKYVL